MGKVIIFITCFLIFIGVFFYLPESKAQPTRDRILSEVTIKEGPEGIVIRIGFNFPVRYIKHFPYESGDELRIKLKPIVISKSDMTALSKREAVKPPSRDLANLEEVIFEGDIVGGPFLTLFFSKSVSFNVRQGADYRSMVVTIPRH